MVTACLYPTQLEHSVTLKEFSEQLKVGHGAYRARI